MQKNPWMQTVRAQFILFVALGFSSAISLVLLALRAVYSGSSMYQFLAWNLLLAWIPLVFAWLLWWTVERTHHRSIAFLLLGAWLLFFPNAPYIVTDLIHLRLRGIVPIWYDALLLFSFAWNGLLLGFVSLWMVQSLVRRRRGVVAGWLVVGATLVASGFGIYLGRFQRWNSWDILTEPWLLLNDVAVHLANPLDYPLTLAVTVLFAGMMLVMYVTLTVLMSVRWHESPVHDSGRR